jgi:hypothetical protein
MSTLVRAVGWARATGPGAGGREPGWGVRVEWSGGYSTRRSALSGVCFLALKGRGNTRLGDDGSGWAEHVKRTGARIWSARDLTGVVWRADDCR